MRTRIQNIVNSPDPDGINIPNFYWGDMPYFNLKLDEHSVDDVVGMTAVLMLPPFIQGDIGNEMYIRANHTYIIPLIFCKTSEMDEDLDTTGYAIVTEMTALAAKFVSRLVKDLKNETDPRSQLISYQIGPMDPNDRRNYSAYFDGFDINVNGVLLMLQVRMIEDFEDCLK